MRKGAFLILLLNCVVLTSAWSQVKPQVQQQGFIYKVTVKGNTGSPLNDIKVWFKEKNKGTELIKRTGPTGIVSFNLPAGSWALNLVGLTDYKDVDVEEGSSGSGSATITYNQKEILEEQDIRKERPKLNFTEVDQSHENSQVPATGNSIVLITIQSQSGASLTGLPVQLVSIKQSKIYTSRLGNDGTVRFQVPAKENYAIDVDGIKNFDFTEDLETGGIITLGLMYEPTTVKEKTINDTITQAITADSRASSGRVYLELLVSDGNKDPMPKENVYLHQISSKRVYKAKTNADGKAVFLLPTHEKYMLSFDFEPDVDVLNYSTAHGICNSHMEMTYIPRPELQHPEQFIPSPEALFLTEFQNFITKNIPQPQNDKVGLFLQWGNDKVGSGSKEAVLELGISAAGKPGNSSAPPMDIAFVLDRSGSMEGYDRIESLKTSMEELSTKLRPQDNVALVSFSDESSLDMPLQKRGATNNLKKYIEEMEAGGGTNMYKGIVMGYEQLMKSKLTGPKHLIVLTDGYCSVEPAITVEKAKEIRSKGVKISAIGVGEDYNYALLKLITEEGGLLEHVGTSSEMRDAFIKQLSQLLYPIAKDASLTVIFNKKIQYKNIFGIQEKTKTKDKVTFDLGELYDGYQKVALAEFDLIEPNQEIEDQPVILELSYTDLETGKEAKKTEKAYLHWDAATSQPQLIVEAEQKKLFAIAIMNQSIKVMADAFAANDAQSAKLAVEGARRQVKDLFPNASDKDVSALIQKLETYGQALDYYIKNKSLDAKK